MAEYVYIQDPKDKPYTSVGKFYGGLVINGIRYLPPDPNPNHVKAVPKRFREETKVFIAWYNQQMAAFLDAETEAEDKEEEQPKESIAPIPVTVINPAPVASPPAESVPPTENHE